jgi:hypothetical protein
LVRRSLGAEKGEDLGHQVLQRLAPVATGDLHAQVEPDALAPMVVRAIRGKEVERLPPVERGAQRCVCGG